MISNKDIRWFVIEDSSRLDERFNLVLTLCGDELIQKEATGIYLHVIASPMQLSPCPVGSVLKSFMLNTLGSIFQYPKYAAYIADIEARQTVYS